LIAHLIGDGYSGTYRSQGNYYNIDSSIRKEFINNIKIFGNIPLKVSGNEIKFPRFIAGILGKLYKISFYTMTSRVPKIFFKYSKYRIGSFLRAFCDDEAWIGDKKIEIYSKNKLLLKDVKKLLKLLKIKTGKVEPHTRANRIRITSEYFELFDKFVGFDYPKKQEQLKFNLHLIKLNNKRGKFQASKNKILKILSESPMTTTQLSRKLFMSESTIRDKHLKQLAEKGLVEVTSKKNRSFMWSVS
jgi:DNA-binding transcriptional ArsR family regulator